VFKEFLLQKWCSWQLCYHSSRSGRAIATF